MTDQKHILVVDDEPEMTEAVSEYLRLRGFTVSTAASGKEMRQHLELNKIDLILLDLGLPGEDGISLTREIRESMQIGIIIVTAFALPLALSGSLLLRCDTIRTSLLTRLATSHAITPSVGEVDHPVCGAVTIARQML